MGYDNFGLKIGVEGEREFKNSIREINSSFKILKSEMNLVTSTFKGNASSMESLTSKSSVLKREIESQKEKITILKSALDNATASFGENDKRTQAWVSKLNYAEAELNKLEFELKDVNSQMEKSKTPLEKVNTELSEQGERLKSLQTQYKNVVLSQGKNSTEAKSLASEIKSLNSDIKENKDKLNAAEKATEQLGDEMNSTKSQASKLSEGFTVMKGVIANLAADAIKRLGRDLVGAVKSITSSGIEFESAFAGVKKTVDATDEEFEQFETGLRSMSTQMPTTASELSAIAEAAGQLGIKNESLLSFTETMANLGVATNMSSDEAATALARLANITGMNQENFDRLGSSIVALGNNFATTESEVTQMALNISAAGSQVGMTEADILGVAAALSSLGLEAQAGGTAISKAIIMMANACETGSGELEYFAKAAGMSTAEFQKYFAEDATGALTKFISGLGNLQDESALKFLDDMEIKETRLRDALLRASNANDLFTDAIKTSNEAWNENSALVREAQQRYATTESKVQILKNTFSEMGLTLYDKVQEPLQNAASKLTEFLGKASESGALKDALDKLSESAGTLIEGISEMVVTLLPPLMNLISWFIDNSGLVTIALGGIVTSMLAMKAVKFAGEISNAITYMKNFGGKILEVASNLDFMRIKEVALTVAQGAVTAAQWLMNVAMSANPIGLIITAIGALVAGFILLWNNCEDFRNFWIGLWDNVVSACSAAWEWISPFFTEWLPNAFNTVVDWVKTNWQGLLLLLVNPIAGAFKLIYDNCEEFRNFVDDFVNSVKEFFINGWNAIVSFFTQTIPQFISDFGRLFGELPYKMGYALGQAIGLVIKWGMDLWDFATTKIPEFIEQVVTFFSELPGKVWIWLCDTANKVSEFFVNLINTGITETSVFIENTVNSMKELSSKVWIWLCDTANKVGIFFENLINTGITKAGEFVDSSVKFIKELPGKIWNGIIGSVSAVASWGGQLLEKGKEAAQNLVNGIFNTICELPGKMLDIGKNIVSGIWNGISNSARQITENIKKFASGILDGMKSALGIHSPSKVFEEQVGKNLALGVGEGFTASMKDVSKQMQKALPTDFSTDLNMAVNSANSTVDMWDVSTRQRSSRNLIDRFNYMIENTNRNVTDKLDSILYFLQDYIPELKNRQLCLDTGILVGELTPSINRELAKIENSRERGR